MNSSDRAVRAIRRCISTCRCFDIFGAFAVGAELHLVPPELNLLPNKLADFIRASELTQWFSVPSVLNYLAKFDVVGPNDFPALRRVLWCGEVLPTPALIYWMQRLPHVHVHEPVRSDRDDDRQQLLHRPRVPRRIRRRRFRSGPRATGEELLVLDDRCGRCRRARPATSTSAASGLAPATGAIPRRTDAAFVPHPQRPAERIYRTGDLARVGDDGLVYFLGRERLPDQEPRLPHRARRDRGGAERGGRRAGVRGRARFRPSGFEGTVDLLRLRAGDRRRASRRPCSAAS